MKFKLCVIICLFLSTFSVHAGDRDEGTAAGVFLKIGAGARPAAMGGAYSAFARDINAVYWNPAGLAYVPVRQLEFMHAELLSDQSLEYFAFATPNFLHGTLGLGFTYVNEGKFDRLTIDNNGFAIGNQGTFRASDMAGVLSYARVINDLISVGVSIKYVYQAIDSYSGAAFASDIGLQFKTPLPNLTGSFLVQDLGTEIKLDRTGFNLPFRIKGGLAYRFLGGKASLALDVSKPYDNDITAGAGGEYWVIPNFAVRLGWNSSNEIDNGITVGAGFRYNQFDIDYAFVPYQELGDMHRVSGTYRFGPIEVARLKEDKIKQELSAVKPKNRRNRYRREGIQPVASLENKNIIDIKKYYSTALDKFNDEDYEGSSRLVESVLIENPEHIPSLILKGQIEITNDNLSQAVTTFEKVILLDPDNDTARSMLDLLAP